MFVVVTEPNHILSIDALWNCSMELNPVSRLSTLQQKVLDSYFPFIFTDAYIYDISREEVDIRTSGE